MAFKIASAILQEMKTLVAKMINNLSGTKHSNIKYMYTNALMLTCVPLHILSCAGRLSDEDYFVCETYHKCSLLPALLQDDQTWNVTYENSKW